MNERSIVLVTGSAGRIGRAVVIWIIVQQLLECFARRARGAALQLFASERVELFGAATRAASSRRVHAGRRLRGGRGRGWLFERALHVDLQQLVLRGLHVTGKVARGTGRAAERVMR